MRDLELESEYEFEGQPEVLGEYEGELEAFGDGESAFGETPLGEFENEGALGELESEWEGEGELEGEFEGEQFFGSVFKRIGGLVKKAAPLLKNVVRSVVPQIAGAIGGPMGGQLGSLATNLLGQSEFEGDGELEFEFEDESEGEFEAVLEGPLDEQQALGEWMAAAASRASSDLEAEAQIGSATAIVLSRADLAALRNVLPSINRGIALLTRVLRRNRGTREAVRVIPTIVKRSAVALRRKAARGEPVTKQSAARAVATQTRRVLGTPSICAKAMNRNVQAAKKVASVAARPRRPQRYAI